MVNLIFNSLNYNTYIIAEIGINHEGDYNLCKEMVYAAKKAGVKAVKLQTIDPKKNYAKDTQSYKIFNKSQLSQSETKEIFTLSKKLNLDIFTTVGDIETAAWVKKLKPSAWKISSSLFTHLPLINYLCDFKEEIFLSTGLANNKEIDEVINVLEKKGKKNYKLLHCVSKYPTRPSEVNLTRIKYLKKKYNVEVGYSDHSIGNLASCIAVSQGASIIEKHFTNDTKRKGFDHKISLDYVGMKKLVDKVAETEKMLKNENDFFKTIKKNREKFLRVIVANKKIKAGNTFKKTNITIKRVKNNKKGLSPINYPTLLGKYSIKSYLKDQIINKLELKND
tara:strand:- start:1792 stop:2799 length:1008 start_codon:yes stop_codon:yes gene_type:complete